MLLGALALSSSAQAAFPAGRDGRIVYAQNVGGATDIVIANADGSSAVNLTRSATDEFDAQFSPDGQRIVFSREVGANQHVFVMNADGSGATNLTPNSDVSGSPTFSPDGDKIAFAADALPGPGFIGTIAVMNADGSGVTDLTPGNSGFESAPDFSPDGAQIVFTRTVGAGESVFVMNADGTLPTDVRPGDGTDRNPSFSPQGTRLGFSSDLDPTVMSDFGIVISNPDGSAARAVINAAGTDEFFGSFSGSGEKLAYDALAGGDRHVHTAHVDGSGKLDITPTATAGAVGPDWETVYRCRGRRATIVGSDGRDKLKGTKRSDVIVGNGGKDRIRGRGGKDRICGGRGKDRLFGGGGKDKLSGQKGKDRLSGGKGADALKGGKGRDRLFGGPGRDKLARGGKDKVKQ